MSKTYEKNDDVSCTSSPMPYEEFHKGFKKKIIKMSYHQNIYERTHMKTSEISPNSFKWILNVQNKCKQ